MADSVRRFLIKLRDSAAQSSLRLSVRRFEAAAEFTLETEPLFHSIGIRRARGLTPDAGAWRLARATVELDEADAWSACHQIAQDANIAFVEPDLQQQWNFAPPSRPARPFGVRGGSPDPQDIGDGYAGDKGNNYWFRDGKHSQLDAALQSSTGSGVRIAHLDTGYDPHHKTVPRRLRADLARNFVDDDLPKDATDRSEGAAFNNFSHGCGTLGILAGETVAGLKPFGCAPDAEIVPVRVANRVVLFSNSTVARGLDYVHALCASDATRVHVVSMSMGGLPSQAWADAINALYEAGVVVVTAAGNNYGNLPTRYIVYPARFNRVVAACGVMADGRPYANLPANRMAGNYGPQSKLQTAMAAYTPNVPWARFGEPTMVDFDGNGTSSATPQIAGSAALWIERHWTKYNAYREPWMRVEAVRRTLFESASKSSFGDPEEYGVGLLRAADALSCDAAPASRLEMTPPDAANWGFLKLLIGDSAPGFAATGATNALLELEAVQLALKVGLDPAAPLPNRAVRRQVMDKMLSEGNPSPILRATLERSGSRTPTVAPRTKTERPGEMEMRQHFLRQALNPITPVPPYRSLRIYAYDPGQQTDPTLFDVSVATLTTRWEQALAPGPIGEYLEVVDIDPASRACYAPVDLNHPALLAQNGLAPSESSPQFHQQMAYAVAMRTIERFERALGRKALWASRKPKNNDERLPDNGYVQRLRIYPHALREANAYYDPEKLALLFGYFNATDTSGTVTAGSRVFSVVSHDIVAHETTHALLDGIHPRYSERTNLDMAAFHEAFADIVALFQHFAMPESLTRQIRQAHGSPGDIGRRLGRLAQQFGDATGMHGALRKFVGETGASTPVITDEMTEPHERGAVLVSAVFEAFLTIFTSRCADLIRLATGGSGILPDGDISVDLANRLAAEASKSAEHVLNMCIRALDYCPPVNLEFGDYLRGLLTADYDLVRDDNRGYRVAFIDAFRRRGIVPFQIRQLAEDSLLWEPPAMEERDLEQFRELFDPESTRSGDARKQAAGKKGSSVLLDLSSGMTTDRKVAFYKSRDNATKVHNWLTHESQERARIRDILGFRTPEENHAITLDGGQELVGEIRPIEVHSVRVCRRSAPDGSTRSTLVIEITQTFRADPDHERYRGGCTLLIDLNTNALMYVIRKRLLSNGAMQNQIDARAAAMDIAAMHGQVYYAPDDPAAKGKAFAMMHRCGRDL